MRMGKGILTACLLFAISAAQAASVSDDFNRADTGVTTDGAVIGEFWAQESITNGWQISTNVVYARGQVAPVILYNTALQTTSGGGSGFSLGLDVTGPFSNVWAGVAFNYQDESNFYCVRFKANADDYQVLAKVAGNWEILTTGHASGIFNTNTFYRIRVESFEPYAFDINIESTDTGVRMAHRAGVADPNARFTGGYAGLYTGNALAGFDNFSLETSLAAGDYFNRPDSVAYSTNAADIGPGWNQLSTTNTWKLLSASPIDKFLYAKAFEAPGVLYNDTLETVSGGGTNFAVRLDVDARTSGVTWQGMVWNYQDDDNFYVCRFKNLNSNYQVLANVNGTWEIIGSSTASSAFAQGRFYTISVTSSNAYSFDVSIVDAGNGITMVAPTNMVDANSHFTGGYAGAYVNDLNAERSVFDNFSLRVVPPAVLGYAGWAMGWGVDIGAETNDYDGDGLLNIYEYGLAGDPTNALDQGVSPEYVVVDVGGSSVFRYVYPKRSDPDSGLTYHLETTTDLAVVPWTNSGYTVDGTNVTGGSLDFVTNSTGLAEAQKFIRLIIE